MSEHKRHHYVPRTYLENFAGEDGFIWTYDHTRKRTFPKVPKEVATKGDYNTITDMQGVKNRTTMEEFFCKSEAGFPDLLKSAIESKLDFRQQIDLGSGPINLLAGSTTH